MSCSMLQRWFGLGTTALLLAGCAGGGVPGVTPSSSSLAQPASSEKQERGTARIVVRIPKEKRRGHYLSPATQSMMVAILQGTKPVYKKTINLTPTSTGCSSTLASTTCTLTILLGAGSYTASISTYDATNGTGNELSAAQGVTFKVFRGKSNPIPLTLSGIPSNIAVFSASTNAVYVLAQDPDGDFIVGAGAPTITAAQTAGRALVTIVQPTAAHPNKIAFIPAGATIGAETIGVTASFPKGTDGCAHVGALCTFPSAISVSYTQVLFVSNYNAGNVLGFTIPLTGGTQVPQYTLSPITSPFPISLDASDDLFVATFANPGVFYEFKPPYANAPSVTNSKGIGNPFGMTIDASGAVYVANSAGSVSAFTSPYTAIPASLTNAVMSPYATAFDSSAYLYVANEGNKTITVYPPPYTATPVTVATASAPYALAVSGNKLYVGENSAIEIFDLSSALTNASIPQATLTTGIDEVYSMAFDANGNLFESNNGSTAGSVAEFTQPIANGALPSATLAQSTAPGALYGPWGIAFDADGNLYVADVDGGTVGGGILEYAPPFSNSSIPVVTISAPVDNPYFVAITKSKKLTITP